METTHLNTVEHWAERRDWWLEARHKSDKTLIIDEFEAEWLGEQLLLEEINMLTTIALRVYADRAEQPVKPWISNLNAAVRAYGAPKSKVYRRGGHRERVRRMKRAGTIPKTLKLGA